MFSILLLSLSTFKWIAHLYLTVQKLILTAFKVGIQWSKKEEERVGIQILDSNYILCIYNYTECMHHLVIAVHILV